MSLRGSFYAPRWRQDSDAKTDFRRAAPAAAIRYVEPASHYEGSETDHADQSRY
jgi:hypothetical protein